LLYLNRFMSSRTLWKFQRFSQLTLMVGLGLIGLLLVGLSLPGLVQTGSPGTVKSSVKIAHNLNSGPVVFDFDPSYLIFHTKRRNK
jgi:hypothetical protein